MAFNIFGWKFERNKKEGDPSPSFAAPVNTDGAIVVNDGGSGVYGGSYSAYLDFDNALKSEAELVTKYREMANTPEFEKAIDAIVDEAIVYDENQDPVSINLSNVPLSESIKEKIVREFDDLIRMLNFRRDGHDIFKRWYIDGRLYYHMIIDHNKPARGILEVRYIDPRKIRKVREEIRDGRNREVVTAVKEYYVYNDRGIFDAQKAIGGMTGTMVIAPDVICYVPSGYMDPTNQFMMSYIHKALRPFNQLRIMEDSVVLARFTRAPMRRVFYIDVGSLPRAKAEEYLKETMLRFRNKVNYDASTGEIRNDKKYMTMLDDYWFARREGGRSTEVDTLQGDGTLSDVTDVEMFRKKLYEALNVPPTRLQADGTFNLGRASEITRDELAFTKFISRLRNRFSDLFNILLRTHLALRGIVPPEVWDEIVNDITYSYNEDNHFTELKNNEILSQRIAMLSQIEPHIGRFYSEEYVLRNVLLLNDKQITEMKAQMDEERKRNSINSGGIPAELGAEPNGDGSNILNFDDTHPDVPVKPSTDKNKDENDDSKE